MVITDPIRPAERATSSELAAEWAPWVAFVFVAGPPLLFVALPLLVVVLSLVWVFALLFALAALFIALLVAVGLASGLVASSRLLIRRRRARRADGVRVGDAAAHLVAVESPRAIS
jgi:small-conductance mechanosensitive channel